MKILFQYRLFVCILALLCMGSVNAGQITNKPPMAKPLSSAQKKAAKTLIAELLVVESCTGPGSYFPLYEEKVDTLAENAPVLLAKVPSSRLKRYLAVAVQAHVDAVTVINECSKYRYYDLIKNQQTPKIIQKYHLPYSLQSNLPYQLLNSKTVNLVESTLEAVAAAGRERAQSQLN